VALYSGLYATTAVEVIDKPLLLVITPSTNFVRYGSTVNFSVTVESVTDVNCTITGGIATPVFITHPAGPLSITYGPFTSENLTATQQIKIDCIDPVDPTNSGSEKATIEIVPIAREV
jgi:outer membrane protein assembly factor BamA